MTIHVPLGAEVPITHPPPELSLRAQMSQLRVKAPAAVAAAALATVGFSVPAASAASAKAPTQKAILNKAILKMALFRIAFCVGALALAAEAAGTEKPTVARAAAATAAGALTRSWDIWARSDSSGGGWVIGTSAPRGTWIVITDYLRSHVS